MISAPRALNATSEIAANAKRIALPLTRCRNNALLLSGGINIVFGEADPPKIDIYVTVSRQRLLRVKRSEPAIRNSETLPSAPSRPLAAPQRMVAG